jgi:hypothetical protein
MKSVRLDAVLEARLREAAKIAGVSESELIRQGIAKRCDEVFEQRLDRRLADVIGIVSSDVQLARRTGDAFRELLQQRMKSGKV